MYQLQFRTNPICSNILYFSFLFLLTWIIDYPSLLILNHDHPNSIVDYGIVLLVEILVHSLHTKMENLVTFTSAKLDFSSLAQYRTCMNIKLENIFTDYIKLETNKKNRIYPHVEGHS